MNLTFYCVVICNGCDTLFLPPARVIDMERGDRLYISCDLHGELTEMFGSN